MSKKKSFALFALSNILIAVAVVAVLVWVTFAALDRYTEHGVEVAVPDLQGAYLEEAEIILRAQGLFPRVIDSVYVANARLGTIVEQIPAANSLVKRNRPVYIITNSRQVRQIPLPGVVDFSSRQAEALLRAHGIKVARIDLVPSQYRNLVIDVLYKGASVPAGHRIPQGESVVLVVGRGLGEETAVIPNLIGLPLENARRTIMNASFIIGATHFDNNNESEANFIYRQQPASGANVPSGTRIDVWLSTDRERLNESNQPTRAQEDDFF
jgi:beta-lactam-binding protein with PASTA domain